MASGKAWNRRLALGGGAAVAAGAAAWALYKPQSSRHQVSRSGVYRRGNVAEPRTLDPLLSDGVQEFEIIGDLMVGLMAHDPDAHPIPGMETPWESSPPRLPCPVHLRQVHGLDGR